MQEAVQTSNGKAEPPGAAKRVQEITMSEPEKRGWSGKQKAALAAAVIAAAIAFGFYFINSPWVSTDDATIEGHVVAVSPRVEGHVLRVHVDDNQVVNKGDLLAELDPRDYQTKLDDAKAAVDGAQANVKKTELDGARYRALAERREASRQTLDHALTDEQAARAELEQAQAKLEQAQLNLSYTRIEAPQAGRVTRKSVEEGAYVAVGQPLLAIVPSEVWVVANFKETQLRQMRPGQRAEIKIDAYAEKLRGHVDSIQAGTGARFSLLPPENATGNFVKVVQRMPVKIVFDDPEKAKGLLAPGMSVEAEVEVR